MRRRRRKKTFARYKKGDRVRWGENGMRKGVRKRIEKVKRD